MGAVSNIVGAVGDVVGGAIEAVGDVGSFVDDAVNDVVPGGWATVGGAALGFGGLEALGGLGEAAALSEGATGLSTLGSSVLPASEAFATGSELASLAEVASPWGLSTAAPAVEFGTFNPAIISAPGIDTAALSGMEYLGGTGSLAAGTAGLTAEQLATATALGQVGTNAASGLGYLGGASSLLPGTAGITGVSSGLLGDLVNRANFPSSGTGTGTGAGTSVAGGNTIIPIIASGMSGGQVQAPSTPNMNANPFNFGTTTPVQTDKQQNPVYLGQLAQLLRG